MRVDELDIPGSIVKALNAEGYVELHPPQAEAIPLALEGKNLVAAIPTASGKSLIGYVPALKTIVKKRRKVLYIVPLKALASEKKDDFDRFSGLGVRVHLSSGDLDAEDKGLADANVVVATSEKADSMIRHGSDWIRDVGLVIADEIHMIHDAGRGPTLEVALTKLMRRNESLQVIALSATISNADDLAEWLHAELVKSDWRPIPLKEGAYFGGEITFGDGSRRAVDSQSKDEVWGLVEQTIKEGGQSIVFVNSRRSTESLAVKFSKPLAAMVGKSLTPAEECILEGDAESTASGRKLAECVRCGAAFHNAGLTYRQRRFIEDGFRQGRIKCIVATPTLAAGINLPARRVVIRDTTRFDTNAGNVPLPVMEIKQMCGRAGRPRFDPYGEAVLVAKNLNDLDHLMDDYVNHDTERLTSKLFSEKVLRSHMLGLIATGDAWSEDSILDFLRDTFFGTTSQMFGIESVVDRTVEFLEEECMIVREGDRIEALPFGKRVSDMCIDPVSASMLRDAVMKITDETEPFQILVAAAMTPDVMGMYPKKCDEDTIAAAARRMEGRYLVDPDDLDDYEYEFLFSDLKTAVLVERWIEEVPEEVITDSMGIGPGDIRSRIDMMDWILYAMNEIALIFNPDATTRIRPLITRIKYGVKEELMELVGFRGVGRTRARSLFDNGIATELDVMAIDEAALAVIPRIGNALAKSMKARFGTVGRQTPPEMTEEEEEAMLDAMAEEYGEAAAKAEPEEAPAPKQKDRSKKGKGGRSQSNLFDFRRAWEQHR
ncbi:MAG: DEAD/DEAH box helicase [Candidatus Methanomethylophilaceae archaeon]|nr:DEAD/DEAH box helicase [Candidatus Methanomethylophilaceae archaeon]